MSSIGCVLFYELTCLVLCPCTCFLGFLENFGTRENTSYWKTLSMGNGKLANLMENTFYGQWKTSQFTKEHFPKCYILNRPPLINSTPNRQTNKITIVTSLFTLSLSTDQSWTAVDWLWTDVDWALTFPKYLFLLKFVASHLIFCLDSKFGVCFPICGSQMA